MTDASERLTLVGVNAKIDGHEDVCAERYKGIAAEMFLIREGQKEFAREIKGALKWAGSLMVTLLIAVSGWGITQQFNAARSDHDAERSQRESEQARLSLLQSQMSTLAASLKNNPIAVNVQPAAAPGMGPSDPANPAATPN